MPSTLPIRHAHDTMEKKFEDWWSGYVNVEIAPHDPVLDRRESIRHAAKIAFQNGWHAGRHYQYATAPEDIVLGA